MFWTITIFPSLMFPCFAAEFRPRVPTRNAMMFKYDLNRDRFVPDLRLDQSPRFDSGVLRYSHDDGLDHQCVRWSSSNEIVSTTRDTLFGCHRKKRGTFTCMTDQKIKWFINRTVWYNQIKIITRGTLLGPPSSEKIF